MQLKKNSKQCPLTFELSDRNVELLPQNIKAKAKVKQRSDGFFPIPWDRSEVCYANLATTFLGTKKSLEARRKLKREKKTIFFGPEKVQNGATERRKEEEF